MHHPSESPEALVKRIILDDLMACYTPPPNSGIERIGALVSTYIKALSFYSESILAAAWDRVKSEHDRFSWPALGKITDACKALANHERSAPAYIAPIAEKPKYLDFAEGIMQSLIGRNAINGKYSKALYDFLLEHGHTPNDQEMGRIKEVSNEIIQDFRWLLDRERPTPMEVAMISFHRTRLAKFAEMNQQWMAA